MSELLLVFIAVSGAAVLGFVFSTSIARWQTKKLAAMNEKLGEALKGKEAAIELLKSETEARMMTIESLKKISQDVENQSFEQENVLKLLRSENKQFVVVTE